MLEIRCLQLFSFNLQYHLVKPGNLEQKQLAGILGISTVVVAVFAIPLLAERFLGQDPITVLFFLMVFYAGLSFIMKRRGIP